jgi:hypothetical protein
VTVDVSTLQLEIHYVFCSFLLFMSFNYEGEWPYDMWLEENDYNYSLMRRQYVVSFFTAHKYMKVAFSVSYGTPANDL